MENVWNTRIIKFQPRNIFSDFFFSSFTVSLVLGKYPELYAWCKNRHGAWSAFPLLPPPRPPTALHPFQFLDHELLLWFYAHRLPSRLRLGCVVTAVTTYSFFLFFFHLSSFSKSSRVPIGFEPKTARFLFHKLLNVRVTLCLWTFGHRAVSDNVWKAHVYFSYSCSSHIPLYLASVFSIFVYSRCSILSLAIVPNNDVMVTHMNVNEWSYSGLRSKNASM